MFTECCESGKWADMTREAVPDSRSKYYYRQIFLWLANFSGLCPMRPSPHYWNRTSYKPCANSIMKAPTAVHVLYCTGLYITVWVKFMLHYVPFIGRVLRSVVLNVIFIGGWFGAVFFIRTHRSTPSQSHRLHVTSTSYTIGLFRLVTHICIYHLLELFISQITGV